MAAGLSDGITLVGVDSVESSVRDARKNAQHNGIEGAEFVAADATELLKGMASEGSVSGRVVLFMDPPRTGSSPEFLDAAAALRPDRIVYISCNPRTQVRDVRRLIDAGYALDALQPVDMFPHTDHVECIASLSLAEEA